MKPKNYWVLLISLIAFASVAFGVLLALLFSWGSGDEFIPTLVKYWWTGPVIGVPFALVMSFLLRSKTMTLAFRSLPEFQAQLQAAMTAIGFHFESQNGTIFTYAPGIQSGILSGRIQVQFGQDSAVIMGAWQHVRRLEKKLGYA